MKTIHQTRLLVCFLMMLPSVTVAVQPYLFDMSIEDLMQVKVYSANKSFQSINNVSANVVVITRSDIEKAGYVTFDDILRHMPGLFLIDTYRDQVIGTRGSVGGSFAFLINGVLSHPANMAAIRADLRGRMNIPVESIDKIEFVRGPQAVTYGDSAFYGSINVITNDAMNSSQVSLATGDNGQRKQFARYAQDFTEGSVVINAGHWKTEGIGGELYDTLSDEQLGSLHPDMLTSLDGLLAHDNYSLDLSGDYQGFYSSARYSDMEYGFYAFSPSYDEGNIRRVKDRLVTIGYKETVFEQWSYRIDYSFKRQTLDIDTFDFGPPFLDGSQNQEYTQHAFDAHANYNTAKNSSLLVGFWHQESEAERENVNILFDDISSHEITATDAFSDTDLYSQFDYSPNDKLNLNAGLRYAHTHSYTVSIKDKLTQEIQYIEKKSSDSWLPQFGMVYHLNRQDSLKFSYGKANQKGINPEARDKDEVIESIELQYLITGDQFVLNSALFFNKIDNLARSTLREVPDPDNPGETISVLRFDNSGELEVYGVELLFKHILTLGFSYNASLSYQSSKDVSQPNIEPGYSPNLLAKIDMTYTYNAFTFNLLANYVDDMRADWQHDDDGEVERIGSDVDSYIDLSANIRYDITDSVYGNLKISNLLDEDIRYPATEFVNFDGGGFGYGRLYLLTVGFQFK